jgi:hypothetical protein
LTCRSLGLLIFIAHRPLQVELNDGNRELGHLPIKPCIHSHLGSEICCRRPDCGPIVDKINRIGIVGLHHSGVDALERDVEVDFQASRLLAGIDDLDKDHVPRLVDRGRPKQGVEVAHCVAHRKRMGAAEPAEHPLLPVARAQHRLLVVRRKLHHVGRPLVPVQVLQTRCIRAHLDHLGVALAAQRVHALGNGGQHPRIVHMLQWRVVELDPAVLRVDRVHAVLAKQDADVGIVRRGLEIVPFAEAVEEELGLLVVMRVPNCAGRQLHLVLGVFIEHGRNIRNIRVLGLESVVQDIPAIRICVREPILIADFDVLDLERLRVTVLGSLFAPSGCGIAHAVLELIKSFLEDNVHSLLRPVRVSLPICSQGEAGIDSKYRLHLHVLAPLKILEQAQSIRITRTSKQESKRKLSQPF